MAPLQRYDFGSHWRPWNQFLDQLYDRLDSKPWHEHYNSLSALLLPMCDMEKPDVRELVLRHDASPTRKFANVLTALAYSGVDLDVIIAKTELFLLAHPTSEGNS
jgi:hypothetical protein